MRATDLKNVVCSGIKQMKGIVKKASAPLMLGVLISLTARAVGIIGVSRERGESFEQISRKLVKFRPDNDWPFLTFILFGFPATEFFRSIRSDLYNGDKHGKDTG